MSYSNMKEFSHFLTLLKYSVQNIEEFLTLYNTLKMFCGSSHQEVEISTSAEILE